MSSSHRSAVVSPEPAHTPVTGVGTGIMVVAVAALLLRIPGLGYGLWHDEIATLIDLVPMPWWEVSFDLSSQNNHVLYTLAAKASMTLFGESIWAFRLPAVVFGVGSVLALYRLMHRFGQRWEAILAAALLATSYHHVWFSQNARGYTALLFFSLLATEAALRLFAQRPRETREGKEPVRWRAVVGYALTLILACLSHLTAATLILVHGGVAIVRRARLRSGVSVLWGCAIASAVVGLLLLPGLGDFVGSLTPQEDSIKVGASEWSSIGWMIMETVRGLTAGLPGGVFSVFAAGIVVSVGLWTLWRDSRLGLVLMVVPPFLLAVALVATSHNMWPRFFFYAGGFAVLISVRGVATIFGAYRTERRRLLAISALALGTAFGAFLVPRAWVPKQDFEAAAAFLDTVMQPGDSFAAIDLAEVGFFQYLERDGRIVRTREQLIAAEREARALWIAYTLPARSRANEPDLWRRLDSEYRERAVFRGTVAGGDIVILESAR